MQDNILIGYIRTTCRSSYDLQQLRIQIGNRIAGNFRNKLGMTSDGMSESELESQEKGILARLRKSHKRITDAIVEATGNKEPSRLQIDKKFKPDDLITEVAELYLMNNYMAILETEEQHFKDMGRLLEQIPIYSEFLLDVAGVGPAMAGVIISEIDIHKAEYPSSLWKFAGLDVVDVVEFEEGGKTVKLSIEQAERHPHITVEEGEFFYKGIPCGRSSHGRNKQAYSLTQREYVNAEGEQAVRNSITFSPFLKTKLLGVLANSFLKVGGMKVDGKSMGEIKRLELAQSMGFDPETVEVDGELNTVVIDFLIAQGKVVERSGSPYSKMYYDYKSRLENDPRHQSKTPIHRHRMALRFMIKQFLSALYVQWRTLEGLPVALPYHEGVLGKEHGVAKEGPWQTAKRNKPFSGESLH